MLPTDFGDAFWGGFDLKASNYSTPGVGGGAFSNLRAGKPAWTRGALAPVFSVKSGLEGLEFDNSLNSVVSGLWPCPSEMTVVAIASVTAAGASNHVIGGMNTASNTWRLWTATSSRMTDNSGSDTATADNVVSNTPFVIAGSVSPMNDTLYAQKNAGTVAVDNAPATVNPTRMFHWIAGIGAHRTSYMAGWVARILIFNRALHYRDNTALQELIVSEMARIGL